MFSTVQAALSSLMAPKRQRAPGSTTRPQASYDTNCFMNEATFDNYHNLLVGKTPISECGLRPSESQSNIAAMIASRGWGKFTDHPKPAMVSIVQEFYVNAKETEGHVVRVRGKEVSYAKAEINAYYKLSEMVGDDEFTEYMQKDIDLSEVIKVLCRPGAEWKSKEHEAFSFAHKELNRYGKAWYYFLCAKLMSTTQVTDVIHDRVVLLYAIVKGMTIDVGQVI